MIVIFQFNNKFVRADVFKCSNGSFTFISSELDLQEVRVINRLAKDDINCSQIYQALIPDFYSLYGILNFLNKFSQLIIIGENV